MDGVSEFRGELGRRIAEAVAKFHTKSAASAAAGVGVEQLNKWIAGEVKVPVDGLWRLALESGSDFCWLCTGRPSLLVDIATPHPTGRPIQESALREALMSLAEVIISEGMTFRPESFADLTFALHDHVVKLRSQHGTDVDLSGLANVMRLAARG